MKKVLVLGGTQFFGKKAVWKMLEKGYEVTIATRGNRPHPFGEKVAHVLLDARDGSHEGWKEVTNQEWDAVFDNVCYTKEDARLLIDKLGEKTPHVFFTSSLSVYEGNLEGYREDDFDPMAYKMDPEKEVDYGEGKRQAETVLFNEAPFKVTAFRFPIVLDEDDHTKRLHFYVEKSLNEETIRFQYADVRVNYVKGSEAADSIVWFMENGKTGPYNISSRNSITVRILIQWLEEGTGKSIDVVYSGHSEPDSPFSVPHDKFLVTDKIIDEGFEVSNLEDWLKPLIRELSEQMQAK